MDIRMPDLDGLTATRLITADGDLAGVRVIGRFLEQPDPDRMPTPDRLVVLTVREREVLALVGVGLSNAQIAERLVVSPHTAKTHVKRAMMKLGAHDRAQLVVIAYETDLIRSASGSG